MQFKGIYGGAPEDSQDNGSVIPPVNSGDTPLIFVIGCDCAAGYTNRLIGGCNCQPDETFGVTPTPVIMPTPTPTPVVVAPTTSSAPPATTGTPKPNTTINDLLTSLQTGGITSVIQNTSLPVLVLVGGGFFYLLTRKK